VIFFHPLDIGKRDDKLIDCNWIAIFMFSRSGHATLRTLSLQL